MSESKEKVAKSLQNREKESKKKGEITV